ncbi:AdoMet dependent proline di-methyltransferase-domain-containing protein [Suillus subluteus]|nr:AdoMet dependent proline di-methyltransferase-domain-containing protein [Suillus subluteus]
MSSTDPVPDLEAGIQYWATQPANYDGVLGGFGTGVTQISFLTEPLHFLVSILLDRVASSSISFQNYPQSHRHFGVSLPLQSETRRVRALDVGAGVGRVTSDVLLPLVSDVVLLEPVEPFINEARSRGKASESGLEINDSGYRVLWKGIADRSKSVTFIKGALQSFDPVAPGTPLDRRSRKALRDARSLIVVKENICREQSEPVTVFDEQDSSFTRSDLAFKNVFRDAGLKIIQEKIQHGLPEGLFPVKMYALREA